MKKIFVYLLCFLIASTVLVSCQTQEDVNKDYKDKVVIYTSAYQFVIDMMDEKLKEKFPDIEVEFFYGGTGSLQTKLAGEMETGTLDCDMLLVADPAYALELKEGGWLHSFEVEDQEALSCFPYDEDGYWYTVRVADMVLAYNPDRYSLDEVPKTFYDFAYDKSLKGKISMGNPLTSGSAMSAVAALTDKYGYEYLDALGKNDVMIESGSTALAKLQTGECKAIMIVEESVLKDRKENGSHIECIYPEDGIILLPSPVLIIDEDKSLNVNTEACEEIANWLLGEEGQQLMIEGYLHSVTPERNGIPYDSIDTNKLIEMDMGVDWERCYKERDELRTRFQEYTTVK